MADPVIVNNPGNGNSESSGMGFLLGIILFIALILLFFYYGLPMIRQATSTPQINVPGEVDVNVNQGGEGAE